MKDEKRVEAFELSDEQMAQVAGGAGARELKGAKKKCPECGCEKPTIVENGQQKCQNCGHVFQTMLSGSGLA